jgi:predicted deacylase
VHATEYAPIDAVMRVVQGLQPSELRGAVIAVPVVNMRMFDSRTGFVSPLDGLNLNKVAPGRADGSISELLAQVLLDEVIGTADYHIDLHAGDFGEMLLPFVGCALTGNAQLDEQGEALARLYSPKLISLSTPAGTIPPFSDGISFAATRKGIVSIFAESGGNGTLEEPDVRVHVDGVLNVMRHLRMIAGTPIVPGARLLARDRKVVRATRAGLLRLHVAIGDEISAGQEVAEVCNVFGEVVERVRSPGAGIAGLVWAHKVVGTGDPIVRYWIV